MKSLKSDDPSLSPEDEDFSIKCIFTEMSSLCLVKHHHQKQNTKQFLYTIYLHLKVSFCSLPVDTFSFQMSPFYKRLNDHNEASQDVTLTHLLFLIATEHAAPI